MINCIVVDDEPLAIELLEDHLKKIKEIQLVGKAKNAIEAYQLLQRESIQLMFLDINMPDLNGTELLKSLKVKPMVIFTTAYREFAIEGFELEAVDYILKPITFERFFRAVTRVMANKDINKTGDTIMIRSEGVNRKLRTQDIIYIESQGNDLKIFLKDASYITKNTIASFAERLSKLGFIRIHRSFIFNPDHVTGYNISEITLGDASVPVGRNYKQEFEDFVKRYTQTF